MNKCCYCLAVIILALWNGISDEKTRQLLVSDSRLKVKVSRQSVSLTGIWPQPVPHDQFVFSLFFKLPSDSCGFVITVRPPTRGQVCNLQLQLGLASADFLVSDFRGTHDQILLLQILDPPSLETQVPIYIFPTNKTS
jgi:hypothetical protein